jgi:ribosomal peptide maturation radical SAM protein 1
MYRIPNKKSDILLIVPPFIDLGMPALAPHLLQSAARKENIGVQLLYSNFNFAFEVGLDVYNYFANEDNLYFLGEQIFFPGAFPNNQPIRSLNNLPDEYGIPDHIITINNRTIREQWHKKIYSGIKEQLTSIDFDKIRDIAQKWSVEIAQAIVKKNYKVIGFTTTLGCINACLSIAAQLKKLDPKIITIIGGSDCEGEMAEGMLSIAKAIDYIFQGESDSTFPLFIKNFYNGVLPSEKLVREKKVMDMNTLMAPDFKEYFQQLASFNSLNDEQVKNSGIKYETSRGCWWNRCKFCGLNGEKEHRYKIPERVMKDIGQLLKENDTKTIFFSDTILPKNYYTTLLPELAGKFDKLKLFLEIKGNVTLEQIIKLRQAGVIQVQPGIESLSDDLLKLMNKGITLREIIELLRYSRATGLSLSWNMLFGFPNDKIAYYEEIIALIPLLVHLPAPINRIASLKLSRFSPYFIHPEEYGIKNLRPAQIYYSFLPELTDFKKLCFFHTGDFESESLANFELMNELLDKIKMWSNLWNRFDFKLPTLKIEKVTRNKFHLTDARNLDYPKKKAVINYDTAKMLLVASKYENTTEQKWAIENDLGIVRNKWFIPLATAEPCLILEMENKELSF